jgi:hypothetical protein
MHPRLHCRLHVTSSEIRLRLSGNQGMMLRACLNSPHHPRAPLTLLESLSLWTGRPLGVALSVEGDCPSWLGSPLFASVPCVESQLVHFVLVRPVRPATRHTEPDDRRQLRLAFRRRAR